MGDKPERRNLHVVTELLLKFIFSCFRNAHRRRPDIISAGRDGCASLQDGEQTYSPPNYIFIKTRTQMFELYVPTSASYVGFCTSGRNCIKRHLKVSESGLCADIFIYIYIYTSCSQPGGHKMNQRTRKKNPLLFHKSMFISFFPHEILDTFMSNSFK